VSKTRGVLDKIIEYASKLVGETSGCIMIEGGFSEVYLIACGDGIIRIEYKPGIRKTGEEEAAGTSD